MHVYVEYASKDVICITHICFPHFADASSSQLDDFLCVSRTDRSSASVPWLDISHHYGRFIMGDPIMMGDVDLPVLPRYWCRPPRDTDTGRGNWEVRCPNSLLKVFFSSLPILYLIDFQDSKVSVIARLATTRSDRPVVAGYSRLGLSVGRNTPYAGPGPSLSVVAAAAVAARALGLGWAVWQPVCTHALAQWHAGRSGRGSSYSSHFSWPALNRVAQLALSHGHCHDDWPGPGRPGGAVTGTASDGPLGPGPDLRCGTDASIWILGRYEFIVSTMT